MKWQPIETAPKDGISILVALSRHNESITTVYWDSYWSLNIAGSYAEDDEVEPTHWMPLPEPPE